jgi:hypothetical protein
VEVDQQFMLHTPRTTKLGTTKLGTTKLGKTKLENTEYQGTSKQSKKVTIVNKLLSRKSSPTDVVATLLLQHINPMSKTNSANSSFSSFAIVATLYLELMCMDLLNS